MIHIVNKEECCGCSACYSRCPKKCIKMLVDEEGFEYPIVKTDECIECGLCIDVCPIKGSRDKRASTKTNKAFLIQHKDNRVRLDSTSGGAFTAIAQYVISKGGIVFGVALNSKLHAYHTYVNKVEDLGKFRNSKYMQSVVGDSFIKAKDFLMQNKIVLFSGTGCQIEGLKMYLGKEYSNLITVDVVCRAVPSPMIFDKYLEYQEKVLGEKIEDIRFRDKFYGYKYSTLNIKTKSNNGKYHHGIESDPWLRAFFANICDRPSCHHCKFKTQYRISDITIWDCFSVSRLFKDMDDDKGTTRMLTHTKRGEQVAEILKGICNVEEIEVKQLIKNVHELVETTPSHKKRKEFFSDAINMSGEELFNKYFPNKFKAKGKYLLRIVLNKVGIYGIVKRIVWKLTDKS